MGVPLIKEVSLNGGNGDFRFFFPESLRKCPCNQCTLFLTAAFFFYLVEGPSISLYLYFLYKKKNPKSLAVHSMVNILRKRRGLMHSLWC
jgi:hypothetical protein